METLILKKETPVCSTETPNVKEEPFIDEERVNVKVESEQTEQTPLSDFECDDSQSENEYKIDIEEFMPLAFHEQVESNEENTTLHKQKSAEYKTVPTIHVEIYEDIVGFKCEVCYLNFNNRKELVSHLKVHWQENYKDKPIACDKCEKRYSQRDSLRRHKIKVHGGMRLRNATRKTCDICKKTFKRWHKCIPPGNEEYSCNACPKKYKNKSQLKTHERTHTDKPFQCLVCSLRFSKIKFLNMHECKC